MCRRNAVGSAAVALLAAGAAQADAILDWNQVTLDSIRLERPAPPVAARALAMVHVAAFDAVNGVVGGHVPYHAAGPAPAEASAEAAAAAAAHRVLVALFPGRAAAFDSHLADSLADVPDGPGEAAGVSWGVEVAESILALRAGDGANTITPYETPSGGGWWVPTPPALAPAVLPNWPRVRPWAMTAGDQFRQAAPPCPNTPEYTLAFQEVRRLGRVDSALRTPEQTQIALFWADGPGTVTPPGHWFLIARSLSQSRGLDLAENARLFALLGITEADAAIVSWDHKYVYSHWRPLTGIQHADTDGNPDTDADPAWTSLIATPPFPAYSSGHSTFSGSGARLLAHYFGGDSIPFDTVSDALPGVVRSFTRLSDAAAEAGQSRIYGGIHWRYDNAAGLTSGRQLADHVFFTQLGEIAPPGLCHPGPTALCLNGGRFKVEATWATAQGSGTANTLQVGDDSGALWFFHPDNSELLAKVVDACGAFGRHWFFVSGTTNVEVVISVTDTQTGAVRRYFNPQGRPFVPVQDVAAFACP